MIRLIVRVDSRSTAGQDNGSVHSGFKTLDVHIPQLEQMLSQGGSNEDGTFLNVQLIGAEIIVDTRSTNDLYDDAFDRLTNGQHVQPEDMPPSGGVENLCSNILEFAKKQPEEPIARFALLALTGSMFQWAKAEDTYEAKHALMSAVYKARRLLIPDSIDTQSEAWSREIERTPMSRGK